MRILALDVGDKRIGVAVSDELGITAQGVGVIESSSDGKDINNILKIADDYNASKIIIGMPKNMNGTLGPRGEITKQFADKLAKSTNITVDFWDERLTTVVAEKTLIAADISRKKRKGVIDKLAAVLILQNYLDFQSRVDTR